MAEAAMFYEQHPVALRLRELQTLIEVAREKNLILVAPTSMGTELGLVTALARSGGKGSREEG